MKKIGVYGYGDGSDVIGTLLSLGGNNTFNYKGIDETTLYYFDKEDINKCIKIRDCRPYVNNDDDEWYKDTFCISLDDPNMRIKENSQNTIDYMDNKLIQENLKNFPSDAKLKFEYNDEWAFSTQFFDIKMIEYDEKSNSVILKPY